MEPEYHHVRCIATTIDDVVISLGFGGGRLDLDPIAQDESHADWSLEPEILQVLSIIISQTRPTTIVELGTYRGRTAAYCSRVIQRCGHGHLYTIDDFRAISGRFAREALQQPESVGIVTQIEKSTNCAFAEWGRNPVDLLIVDAGHDYISACTDFALWARLVPRGGWIVFHDTVTRLERRFPEDYISPLDVYSVLDVVDLTDRPRGSPWQGTAFVRQRSLLSSATRRPLLCPIQTVNGACRWAGAYVERD